MGLTLERMRYLTRKGLGGLSDTELTDPDCDELLNLSLWELEDKYPFTVKESLFSTTLVTDQQQYSIADADLGAVLDYIRSVAIIDSNGDRKNIARMTRAWLDANYKGDNSGFPTKYLRENTVIFLDPPPSADENGLTLEISVSESVASLVYGLKEATGLPRNWDELVVKGAIWRGHFYNEDYNLSRQSLDFQVSKIRETVPTVAKEEKNTHVGGLDVLWDWPEDK